MNTRDVVRRLRAFQAGAPTPRGETRHFTIAEDNDILIVAFVRMGGESRPWGIAFGHPSEEPTILSVPEGRNREALVALRKLGKREVQGILAAKAAEMRQEAARKPARSRKKRR